MRKIIVATLLLTPMLLNAQASSPAQPQASGTLTLQSKFVQPTELNASEADHTAPPRISTGVESPKLIHTVAIQSDYDAISSGLTTDRKVVVEMVVDETGKPSDLKIVQSLNPLMDKNVLAAVSQYRYKPGTLDGEPTSIPVSLQVTLRTPLR